MKQIEIKPADLVFTRMSEFEPLSGLQQIPESEYWEKVPPIIVMRHPAREAYLIYNGNHRAMVAKSKKIMVRALLVESEEDLSKIPAEESMYYSDPEYYREYDRAIARLIKKSELFKRRLMKPGHKAQTIRGIQFKAKPHINTSTQQGAVWNGGRNQGRMRACGCFTAEQKRAIP